MTELTAERLRSLLSYDPLTGDWVWLNPPGKRWKRGDKAGRRHAQGYWDIGIEKKRYRSARLAFLYVTGFWPEYFVDHIDGSRDNDRWLNLREATKSQNAANSRKPNHNTSGFKGVGWAKNECKWVAQIKVNGRHFALGYFDDPQVAHAAYVEAAKRMFGEFARHA